MKQLWDNFQKTFAFMKGHLPKYSTGIVGMTTMRCTAALLQAYLLQLFLKMQGVDNIQQIIKLFGLLLLYAVIILAVLPVFQFWFNGQAKYGHCAVNKAIYHKYGNLPMDYFEKNHSGKIMSLLLNDTWLISGIFMRHFRRVVAAVITILIYAVPMMVMDYRITTILLVISIVSMLVNIKVAEIAKRYTKAMQIESEEMTSVMNNILAGMSVIRMYRMHESSMRQFVTANQQVTEQNRKENRLLSGLAAYQYLMYAFKILLFLGIGTVFVQNGLSSFASILAIMSLQSALDQNFQELGTYYPQLINGLVATERVYDFLELEEEKDVVIEEELHLEKRERTEKRHYLEFDDVTFSYPESDGTNKEVLKHFCLQIDKGEHVALVGESGCGKSTVIKLLSGLYEIGQGTIFIDGIPTQNMSLEALRESISYVPQEPELYHTTILENIRYGKWNATEGDIIQAVKQANAYEFIMNLPAGFDTIVEENGENLSGGQRQRIAIARALLKDAPILILDEATAALDHETENKINEMMQYCREKTILMIAHRESTLKYADRIVKM